MWKKILILTTIPVAVLVVILALHPVWLPWAAGPVLKQFGVEFENYERIGYERFALHGVTYARDGVRFEASRVETFGPFFWGRVYVYDAVSADEYLIVEDWRLRVEGEREKRDDAGEAQMDIPEIARMIEANLEHLQRWLPRFSLHDGRLDIGEERIDVSLLFWRDNTLVLNGRSPTRAMDFTAEAELLRGEPFHIRAEVPDLAFRSGIEILPSEERLDVTGIVYWHDNPFELSARFGADALWPLEGQLRADEFAFPADLFRLEGYEDIVGTLIGEWTGEEFMLEVTGESRPVAEEVMRPPLDVEISARGDMEAVHLYAMRLQTPWFRATLDDILSFDYSGRLIGEGSRLDVAVDLSAQPFLPVEGAVVGRMTVDPSGEIYPRIAFHLQGTDLEGYGMSVSRVSSDGSLAWPLLDLERLSLATADGSEFGLTGRFDFGTERIEHAEFGGEILYGLVDTRLPENMSFRSARVSGSLEGPMRAPRHRGSVEVGDVNIPRLRTGNWSLSWNGQETNVEAFGLNGRFGNGGEVDVAGSIIARDRGWEARLEVVRLFHEEFFELREEAPSVIHFIPGENDRPVTVKVEALSWRATNGFRLNGAGALGWPDQGDLYLSGEGFEPSAWEWLVEDIPGGYQLDHVYMTAKWDRSPIDLNAELHSIVWVEDETIRVGGSFGTDSLGIWFSGIHAVSRTENILSLGGRVPLTLEPGREEGILNLDTSGRVILAARTDPESGFWERLAEYTGVTLDRPRVELDLSGRLDRPRGFLRGELDALLVQGLEDRMPRAPSLENFRIDAVFDTESVHLQELRFLVEGQAVEASGNWPTDPEIWGQLVYERTLPDWRTAEGRLRIIDAEIAPFAQFYPDVLSPQGRLDLDLRLLPGGSLEGMLTIEDAATRPLLPYGPVQEINADVRLTGREVEVAEISGFFGGEEVVLSGRASLPGNGPLAYDFQGRGKNLPLARQPGLVIRGDVDIRLARSPDGETRLTGDIGLRDSFFFQAAQDLFTVSPAAPERRPPYFNVGTEPFSEWILDLRVRGDRFLRVRNPLFRGVISADVRLEGTLGEPISPGRVRIDSGAIPFPFATMKVTSGEIVVSRDSPFQPRIFVTAETRAFGYDVTLNLNGTVDSPQLEFSSTPALGSESILLMLTAGELPQEDFAFSGQQRAARLAFFIGRQLFMDFDGDDDGQERVAVRSGEDISEQGRETYNLEIRLHEQLSLIGEYDKYDEVNVGLKWRFYSR